MAIYLQQTTNMLMLWAVYTLVAVGLSVIFSVMRIINFAHAQFYMLGAYGLYVGSSLLGMPFPIAVLGSAVSIGVIGLTTERWLIRPVGNDQLRAMAGTLGILLALGGAASLIFGPQDRYVPAPISLNFNVAGTQLSAYKFAIAGAAAISVVGLVLFLRGAWAGRATRAVAQDRLGASLQGIRIGQVRSLGFFVGSTLAGLAGALVLPISSVNPSTGDPVLLKMFIILILGGLGSVPGAVVGALVLAAIETLGISFFGQASILAAYVLVILVILWKPAGLLGEFHGGGL
jgi:branched-chain amino acid transport system permease protein